MKIANEKIFFIIHILLQADKLSLAFITGKADCVMLRVDSAQSDYLMLAMVSQIIVKIIS